MSACPGRGSKTACQTLRTYCLLPKMLSDLPTRWRDTMKMRLILLSAAVLLAGCQSNSTVRDVVGKNQFTQLEGASLVLNQALRSVPAKPACSCRMARCRSGFNSYRRSCGFEIKSVQHDGVGDRAGYLRDLQVQGSLTAGGFRGTHAVCGIEACRDGRGRWRQSALLPGLPLLAFVGETARGPADDLLRRLCGTSMSCIHRPWQRFARRWGRSRRFGSRERGWRTSQVGLRPTSCGGQSPALQRVDDAAPIPLTPPRTSLNGSRLRRPCATASPAGGC